MVMNRLLQSTPPILAAGRLDIQALEWVHRHTSAQECLGSQSAIVIPLLFAAAMMRCHVGLHCGICESATLVGIA